MLRHWTVDDVPAMARAVEESIDHLRPWMPWIANEPMTLEDRRDRVEGWAKGWNDGGDSYFGVFREGEAVGGTGMHRRLGPGVIEIGYWIGRKHVRNGYATEPARAQVDASFSLPDIDRVEIHHDEANVASRGIPERLGFTMVRKAPKEADAPAESGIEWQWAVTRTEWGK